MLKGKFEIHEVTISNTISKDVHLKLPEKLIKHSLGDWGNASPDFEEHNEKVLKLGQGVIIGLYVIENYDVAIFTCPEIRRTYITLTEDFLKNF